MAVAIKRVVQFGYSKMNSVQSEQTRIRAKNKYRNEHIDEKYKKFNIKVLDNTEGLTYNQYYKKYCKRGRQIDKDELGEKDFYLAKMYNGKGNSGKETTCVETMVISLNDRIEATPEAILKYQKENNEKMQDFVEHITKTDERFKDCRFLNIDWHFDEVYTPYERLEPTEKFPDGEIVIGNPRISVHCHITYIPLIKEITSNGNEYYSHNRGAVWKSKTSRYNQSYSQFNDEIYEAVEQKYGYERGELYPASKEDRKDMNIQDFILDNNQKMEEEYRRQHNLALKIEEEKTALARGELVAEHKKRMDAGVKRIEDLEAVIKDQEEYNSALKIENINLEKRIETRRMKTTFLSKQLEEKEIELNTLKEKIEKNAKISAKIDREITEKMDEYKEICAGIERSLRKLREDEEKRIALYDKKQKEVDDEIGKLEVIRTEAQRQRKLYESEAYTTKKKREGLSQEIKILAHIEMSLEQGKMTEAEAINDINELGLDDLIRTFRDIGARETTPNLHNLSHWFDENR